MKNIFFFLALLLTGSNSYAQSYWSQVTSGTTKRLMSVSFGSTAVGYISGADSLLLKTTNGGLTWTKQSFTGMNLPFSARDIVHLDFVSATTGYAIAGNFENPLYSGILHKTTNGGASWTPLVSGNIASLSTFFFDENNGFQVGSAFFAGKVVEKMSGGVWGNYKSLAHGADSFLHAIDFYNSSIGIVGGDGGQVYRTFNGGVSWDTVQTVTDTSIFAIRYLSHRSIIAGIASPGGSIMISHDTGRTWQLDMNTLTFMYPVFRAIVSSKRDSFIAVGNSTGQTYGTLLRLDNGTPNAGMAPQPLWDIAKRNDSVVYAVGDSGVIMTNAKYFLSVADAAVQGALHIYPNPSGGIFTVASAQPHTIRIIDIAGKVIYRNDHLSRQHEIDLAGRAAGIYILEARRKNGVVIREKISKE